MNNNALILVDSTKLRELVAGLDLHDEKTKQYIEARWLKYVEWWDSRANSARKKYYALRSAVVIAGALIPALVGLRELVEGEYGWIFTVASIVASLIVAICAGIESLFNFGDIWREKRAAAELIKSEGFSFFQLIGEYTPFKSHQEAYPLFARNVENLIRNEIKDYIFAISTKNQNSTLTSRSTGNEQQG
jgi:hypothetical protein